MTVLKRVLNYFRLHLPLLSAALLAMAGVAVLTSASMWILKEAIDKALSAGDLSALKDIVVLVLLIYFMKATLTYAHDYMTYHIGQSIVRRIRNEVYRHIHHLSMDFYTKMDSAHIVARLTNDAQALQQALTKIPVMVVRDGLTIIFLSGLLFYLHWKMALFSFLLLPVCGGLLTRFGKSLRRTSRLGQEKMADLYLHIREAITGAAVVKAFQREEHEVDRFSQENLAYFKITMKNARVEALSSPVMEFLGAAALSLLLWFGGKDVIDGHWTTGAFFAFIASALSLYQPVKNFSKSNATLQLALSGAERIFQLRDITTNVKENPGAPDLKPFNTDIRFENIEFHYVKGQPVIKNLNATVNKGDVVALVGPSGSGKTTLAGLLLRFYDAQSGRIAIDGQDIGQVSLKSLRSQIGIVTQETLLFNDTVRSNIRYAKENASTEEIKAAAVAANAWEFIEKLPKGLDTVVGERGVFLSGGQKQRLAIARAILKDPPILILDEATSSLDAASEKLVQNAVENLMENRTVIVIAHRLATIKNANRIFVIEHGHLVETGTHSELLDKKGLYSKLYKLQFLES